MGYFLWQEVEKVSAALTDEMVDQAVAAARHRNERVVIEVALSTASPRDLDVLRAMAEDDGPSTAGDIGARIGARPNTVGNYRARLIDAGLIEPAGYGLVRFATPGLRENLRRSPR